MEIRKLIIATALILAVKPYSFSLTYFFTKDKKTCHLIKLAMSNRGNLHYYKAKNLLNSAAKTNNPQAQDYLGLFYANNNGTIYPTPNNVPASDFKKALYWYKKASAQGYAPADYDMSYTYIYDLHKLDEGKKYLIKSAGSGFGLAEAVLSDSYFYGKGGFNYNLTMSYVWSRVLQTNEKNGNMDDALSDQLDALDSDMSFFARLHAHYLAKIYIKKYGNKHLPDNYWYPCGDINSSS